MPKIGEQPTPCEQPVQPCRSDLALSTKEAAALLRTNPKHLTRWTRLGIGPKPYYLPGLRTARWRLEALVTWLEELERTGRPAADLNGAGER